MTGHTDLLASIGLSISVAAGLAFVGHRLRQPPLLAYLLAGVLIGPQMGLGLVNDQASIETVSQIGLILLLFIIGLELDLNKLLAAGRPVLIAGLLQFPLCVALGLAFFMPFGLGGKDGDFGLLYVAVCLAISSTMIVVKLLYDKFELDTLPGRITLGVLIFQDVWAIVVLAIQPNLLNPELVPLLESMVRSVVLVSVSLIISKTVLPRLFKSVAKVPELVLIGSLAWCRAEPAARRVPDPAFTAPRASGEPAAGNQSRADERIFDGGRRIGRQLSPHRPADGQHPDARVCADVGRIDLHDRVQPPAAGMACGPVSEGGAQGSRYQQAGRGTRAGARGQGRRAPRVLHRGQRVGSRIRDDGGPAGTSDAAAPAGHRLQPARTR
ncbi:MAG: cation:proton antiporter [Betaproteobacteria bacterium]|nr:cation:proton antiporter [Betaproteobacteria bacterium]